MGSVRVYKYPVLLDEKEIMYDRIYIHHLNEIHICVLSPDSRTLLTVSRYDKAIHIWKLHYNQPTI